MNNKDLSAFINIGPDILSTEINPQNNIISAQVGDSINSEVDSPKCEYWQPVGFASRPALAEPGKSSCQVLLLDDSTFPIVFATRDNRCASKYGDLKPGETCIYAPGPNLQGNAKIELKDDGTTARININPGANNNIYLGDNPTEAIALAPKLVDYLNANEEWAKQVDLLFSTILTALGIPVPPTYTNAITDRLAKAAFISSISSQTTISS